LIKKSALGCCVLTFKLNVKFYIHLEHIFFSFFQLTDISITDPEKYPHMLSVKSCFIRGSVVRYVQLPSDEVDTQLLQDAARKEVAQAKN
jgi:hypothetical protein